MRLPSIRTQANWPSYKFLYINNDYISLIPLICGLATAAYFLIYKNVNCELYSCHINTQDMPEEDNLIWISQLTEYSNYLF